MPVVTRSNKVSPISAAKLATKPALRQVAPPITQQLLELPTVLSDPVHDLDAYSILVHGEPGIGKTSTAMVAYSNTLLITFDPPQKSLSVLQVYCADWVTFARYVNSLAAKAATDGDQFLYKRIVIDGIDKCFQLCQEYTEKVLGVKDVADADWGKGWNQLSKNFTTQIRRLMGLTAKPTDCGVWFISHSVWRDVEVRREQQKVPKLVPLMKGGADREITGLVDCVFAYQFVDKQHVMIVRGDERTYAKCRIDGHFLTPKGERVIEVPMGGSAEEGWKNLLNAFHNKQTFTHVKHPTVPVNLQKGGQPATATKAVATAKPGVKIKFR